MHNLNPFAPEQPEQHVVAASLLHHIMHEDRVAASDTLRRAEDTVRSAVRPAYDPEQSTASADTTTLAAELYARLYEGGQVRRVEQARGAAWERRVHDTLDGAEGFQSLTASVAGDPDFAALALAGVLDEVAEQVAGMLDSPDADDSDSDGDSGGQGAPGQGGAGQGQGAAGQWGISAEDALQAALAMKADELAEQIEDTRRALNGLAPGMGDTPPKGDKGDPRRLQLAERLSTDERLRAVLRKAGRLARIHGQSRKTKVDGYTEIVDIERGGDLARVLPHTLALLDDPDLGDAVLADLLNRKAMQFALGGEAPVGRGPVVVLRDVSSSMHGEPHAWAAAVTIVAAQVAHAEHRKLTIADFNARVHAAYRMDANGRSYWRMHADKWVALGGLPELVLALAGAGCCGGTRMDPALAWAIEHGDLMADRADLVLVTDGRADSVRPDVLAEVTACKEQGLRISALTINSGTVYPALGQVCDDITDLDRDGDTARQAAAGLHL